MISRRLLMKMAGAGAAGTAIAMQSSSQTAAAAPSKSAGTFDLPKGMTLLAIRNTDGPDTLGVKMESGVLDVAKAASAMGATVPLTLDQMLQEGRSSEIAAFVEKAAGSSKAKTAVVPEDKITYGKLFSNPSQIICVGLNYRRHAAEVKMPVPKQPILFNKYTNALASHNCTITLPAKELSYKFDYETELLVVIGKAARNVSETDAPKYIAGFCTSNDFSARDLQLETGGQWMIGKTLDNFAPIGPYFVSSDLAGDPHKLKLETYVNGEVRQSWSTDDFVFNTYQVVSYVSKYFTLKPGDIIFTGTPHGVIQGMPKDKQVWLKAGDKIESRIEKLGTLKFDLA